MKKIAREFADIYRFFWKTPIGERSVVFYAEHEGYFAYFEGLIRELTELRGLTIAYITSDVKDPIFSMEKEALSFMQSMKATLHILKDSFENSPSCAD